MTSTAGKRSKSGDTFSLHKNSKMSTKFGAIDLCCQRLMDIVLIDETQQEEEEKEEKEEKEE